MPIFRNLFLYLCDFGIDAMDLLNYKRKYK